MGTRTITDNEIVLIKAMLGRRMKNKDIQFFFNRPDRSVNSGRITGIRNGTYSNSASIPAASIEALDTFIAAYSMPPAAGDGTQSGAAYRSDDPLSRETPERLFRGGSD